MSRNMMVLFLFAAVVCATVMSQPQPTMECPVTKPPTKKPTPPTKKPTPPIILPKCPKNEIYNKCGPARQPTCKNPNPICHEKCVAGCFCKKGQLRNKWGKCVEPCDC